METKLWYKSRTLWVNIVTGLALAQLVLSFFGITPDQSVIEQFSTLLVLLNPILNFVLRLDTSKGLSWK